MLKANSVQIKKQITEKMYTLLRERQEDKTRVKAWISFVIISKYFLKVDNRISVVRSKYEKELRRQKKARMLQIFFLESMKAKALNIKMRKIDWAPTEYYTDPPRKIVEKRLQRRERQIVLDYASIRKI